MIMNQSDCGRYLSCFQCGEIDCNYNKALPYDKYLNKRNKTKEWIMLQYYRDTLPMHNLYIEPSKQFADIIVDGTQDFTNVIFCLQQFILEKSLK